jgi:hypothetical protein
MADLFNKITEQLVEGVDADLFLSEVEDPANWERKDAEAAAPAAKKSKATKPDAE